MPHIAIILGFVILATVITQFISNVPAISIVTTVSVPVAMAAGMNPTALAFAIAMAAQMSYALPIAAPQMAIVYGNGGLRITEFVKVGVIMSLISIPIVTFFVYYWANFIFPFA
jgi:di/tricarboxylate transporter